MEQQVVLPLGCVEVTDQKGGRRHSVSPATNETRCDLPPVPPSAPKPAVDTAGLASSISSKSKKECKDPRSRWDPGNRSNKPVDEGQASASFGFSSTLSRETVKESGGSRSSDPKKSKKSSSRSSDPKNSTHSGSNYSNPSRNEAWNHQDKLIVPMLRNMLDNAAAFPDQFVESDLELNSITVGQIADLCHLQHLTRNCGENIPGGNISYTPLNPYRMSTMVEAHSSESVRIDARIDSLKAQLLQFQ
jgi:hypothetical protein